MTVTPFAASLALSLVLAALVDWGLRRRRVARPDQSLRLDLSGVILLMAYAVSLALRPDTGEYLGGVLYAGCLVFLVSALTDRWPVSRGLRFAAAVLAGFALCGQGLGITTIKLPFTTTFVHLGWGASLVTALWLALSGSLFARAATIPRVSLGIGAMAAATLYAVCLMQPEITGPEAPVLALSLAGACLGMLAFPGRLAGGGATAGGYVLGFLVGAAAIMGALKHTAFLVALLPLMVIGVPFFAAGYSWLAGCVRGRRTSIWRGHHAHLNAILLNQGYSEKQVAYILLAGTALLCALAILLVAIIEYSFAWKSLLLLLAVGVGLPLLYTALRLMKPAHPPQDPPAQVHLLGIRVDRVTMPEAMDRVEKFIHSDRPHMIVTSDAIGIMRTMDDPRLRDLVNQADLVTADGAGVILAARLLGLPLDVRVSGCDMVVEISRVAAKLGRTVYLLGAAPGVAEQAAAKLLAKIEGLQVAGCRDGYFKPEDEPEIIAEIIRLRPAALFVALGIPRQENWITAHMAELGVPVCIGIGGSFDVISGLKTRAPKWMQRCGLEWLHRVAKEPSRLPRLWALPRIVLVTFRELLQRPDAQSTD